MRALTSQEENHQAVEFFRTRLAQISSNFYDLEWMFPNGDRLVYPTYLINTHLGEIQIGVPESWSTRVPHLIRLKRENGPQSPDVEINIPIEHDRRVSGLYVKAHNEYWLCSRGSFTAFRGRIKRESVLAHFHKWLFEIDDAGKSTDIIPICSLSSPTIADDIATFVASVYDLKQAHKAGEEIDAADNNNMAPTTHVGWENKEEFEGKKTTGKSSETEYEYLHGPLCNQLIKHLENTANGNKSNLISKNHHYDAAIFEHPANTANVIFEVKISALPSAQIYSAIGQLHYYKHLYGHSGTKLVLVLPAHCKSIETEKFIESIGVYLVYGDSGKFSHPNGEIITNFV